MPRLKYVTELFVDKKFSLNDFIARFLCILDFFFLIPFGSNRIPLIY